MGAFTRDEVWALRWALERDLGLVLEGLVRSLADADALGIRIYTDPAEHAAGALLRVYREIERLDGRCQFWRDPDMREPAHAP
jgi:hypothetical protein